MKIRGKLQLLFSAAIILTVMIVGTMTCSRSYYVMMDEVNVSFKTTAELVADNIGTQLASYMDMVVATSHDSVIAGDYSNEEKIAVLNKYVEDYGFTSGNLLDKTGTSLIDGKNFGARDYVQAALKGTVNVSDMTQSLITMRYGVSVAAPVYSANGDISGVVYYRMDDDFMQKITANISVSENSRAYIVDKSGMAIVHPDSSILGTYNITDSSVPDLAKLSEKILAGETGNGSYMDAGGSEVICGYAPIANTNGWALIIESPRDDYYSLFDEVRRQFIGIIIGAVIISCVVGAGIAGGFSVPLVKTKEALVAVAAGDFTKDLPKTKNKDEIGVLQNTTSDLIASLRTIIGDSKAALEAIASYELDFEELPEYSGDFDSISVSINEIKRIMGDLILNIQRASNEVAIGAKDISNATNMLSAGALSQANSISDIVNNISDMNDKIQHSSENGALVNEKLTNLNKEIKAGNEQMTELLAAVNEVEEMSASIQAIVATIDNISFQTNILALNASVEAARAGKNGKGFAVVANEVGSLAAKSSDSSKATAELIESCIASINKAKRFADKTFESLTHIVSDSASIAQAFDEMMQDTKVQAENTQVIQKEIKVISDVVQSNTATAEETAASTTELSEQIDTLGEMISKFRI